MASHAQLYETHCINMAESADRQPAWKKGLPSRAQLRAKKFGRPTTRHSFTQEACFETSIHALLESGCLDYYSFAAVCDTHPVVHQW